MAKIFLHALSISKRYSIIAFLTSEGSAEDDVDGQLLHAIKAFRGADWSFVVELMASNQSFPYRRCTPARVRFVFFSSSLFTGIGSANATKLMSLPR